MIHLQSLNRSHFSELLRINEKSFPGVSKLAVSDLDRVLAFGGSHWVALNDENEVKGYMLTFSSDSTYDGDEFRFVQAKVREPFLYVDQIAVARDCLRSGIGRQLYQSVFERAHAADVRTVCCEVNVDPPNPESMAFHRSLGFLQIGEGTVMYGWKVAFLKKTLI